MYSTCRALQSLLATNLPTLSPQSPKTIRAPPHLGSPIALTSGPRAQPKKPKSHTVQNAAITKPSQPRTPPRRNLKRRRSFSDCSPSDPPPPSQEPSRPSTPKRQRTHPPTLPLGLSPSDFFALSNPATTPPHTPLAKHPPLHDQKPTTTPSSSSSISSSPSTTHSWSTTDDSALVSLILSKLRLRQSDWDECARELGKEKDSIGRRWAHLLGDGEVGLRRGRGNRVRGDVCVMQFGPLLPRVGMERDGEGEGE
ncbi:hypothetical protein IMSHALPRED_000109 [Imshaugia aleurites]|uniref:Myb-like domain-containing protein n=1 Tax=Imshaugia aleurites TaxID=172621 RepID=A0A8H3I4Q3_9LECA|nr:hypothetical protein IMSHALPRED_000109 [Imshaugia aleurites]